MNELQIFNNEEFGEIRVIGDFENPQFCLADVCRVLELDASQVMKRLDDGVVSIHPITDSLGRTQMANFVNEDGLYDVILDSRKPNAKKFRKWLTKEVVPTIRKTGSYSVEKALMPLAASVHDIGQTAEQLQKLFALKRGIALSQAIDMACDKYSFDFNSLKKLLPPAEHETGYLNATQLAPEIGVRSPKFVNEKLARFGLQYKDGHDWRLTEAGKEFGEEMPYTRNGHSGYQIRWNSKVVEFVNGNSRNGF